MAGNQTPGTRLVLESDVVGKYLTKADPVATGTSTAPALKVTGGTPAAGKVLTALDSTGLATWAPSSGLQKTLKTMSYTNSGMDQSVAGGQAARTNIGMRIPIRMFEDTIKWRVKMRNASATANGGKVPLTGQGIQFGEQWTAQTPGMYLNNVASTIEPSTFTIPGDGTWYYSSWITDPTLQMKANVEYLIGTGYTMASVAVAGTVSKWFYFATAAAALTPATAATAPAGTAPIGLPLDFVVEYQVNTARTSWLWIGDSISEGIMGPVGTAQTNNVLPVLADNYPNQWARDNNALVNNMSGAGYTAGTFSGNQATFLRMDHAGAAYDGLVIALGSNDFNSNVTLAVFQANITTIVNKARAELGLTGKPLVFVNILPRSTGTNSLRLSYNDWMATLPLGATAYVDMSTPIGGASPTAMPAAMTSDTIHPSYAATAIMKNTFQTVVPTPTLPASNIPRNNDLYRRVTQAQFDALGTAGRDPNMLYIVKG